MHTALAAPLFSQGGERLYSGAGDDTLLTLDPGTGAALRNVSLGGVVRSRPAVSPDGLAVYLTATDGKLYSVMA